ncbi:MAG: hypothetical protein MSG64_09595 [Pyrinomonadaceae bacterium MAG19_C2-C3]|nr:hypothetical protein [Pyrinomonadaceae bacterium MAG19_C2-C3]
MENRTRWYAYATVIILGTLAPICLSSLIRTENRYDFAKMLVVYWFAYLLLAIVPGVLWRNVGWRWGIWLSSPLLLLSLMSLGFAGGIAHLGKDVLVLAGAVIASCLGAYIGANVLRQSRRS